MKKSKSLAARIVDANAYKDKLARANITHALYVEARDKLHAFTGLAPSGRIVFAVGASGAGKSKAARSTIAQQKPREKDARYEPLISTEVTSTVSVQYAIPRLVSQLLIKLRHPIYGRSLWEPTLKTRTPPYKLDEALRQALISRKTFGVWVDECHPLFKTESENLLRANADALKGLVSPGLDIDPESALNCYLVAIGGYLLLSGGLESSHFNRRVQVVHFERYKLTPPHLKAFKGALSLLDCILPLGAGFSLSERADFFYQHSHGVFGVVVDWCYWALGHMCIRDSDTLAMNDFVKTRLKLGKYETLGELQIGEKLAEKLSDVKATDADIKKAFKEAREHEKAQAEKELADRGGDPSGSPAEEKAPKTSRPFKKAATRLHGLGRSPSRPTTA